MIEMPETKKDKILIFAFKSETAAKEIAELNQTLSKFGAKGCKTTELLRENEPLLVVTVE
jgi:hypothetical protein